jgi:D-alanyl-D-alanine carboxypeptidase (penicillin-binding protein 5/6)
MMLAPFQLDALVAPAPASAPAAAETDGRRRHARAKKRWSRKRTVVLLVVIIVLLAAGFVVVRLRAPEPRATASPVLHPHVQVAAAPVTLPWPATGQAAISVPAIGVAQASGVEQPVPVASLTKMMTGYVILRDHPLAPGQDGPSVTITPTDVTDYDLDTTEDQANALVSVGEILTERQLLSGLLIHSANNFADTLARWDAGSIPAFVVKMNAMAAQLGMHNTHYADASGFDNASQSTASDSLKVAAVDMDNPTFAAIVRMTSVTLPVAGTISTYTPLIGLQGVIGVKSGFTSMAGGCDVLALVRSVHGLPVLILSAVTGQLGAGQANVLALAGLQAYALANAVGPKIGATSAVPAGTLVANVTSAGHTVPARATSSVSVLTWPGVRITRAFAFAPHVRAGARKGARIGTVAVSLGTQHLTVPVVLGQDLPEATLLQRVF